MIVGLTGRNGAGKGTVAAWFADRGFECTSLSDAIRDDMRARGTPITRDNLIAAGRRLRREGGPGVLAEKILARIAPEADFVVDSVRNPAEVEVLRGRAGFVFIEVTASEATRYARMVTRARGGDAGSFEEFRRQEAAELNSTDSAAQRLVATAALADVRVSNEGDLAALHAALAVRFPEIAARGTGRTA